MFILSPLSKSIALCFIFRLRISSSTFLSSWTDSISALSIAIDLSSFSIPCLLNTLTSITTPVLPDGSLRDESLTSVAFSPKIDLNSFSSGLDDVSLFGVTLPTKISPGFTSAPTYTIPDSSRFLKLSSLTLGMSLVISSAPNFVSLAIDSYSSMWTEVNTSSVTHLSDIKIESSKLYPCQGINATVTFLPKANSPSLVAGPSAIMSPFLILSPTFTKGF